METNNIFRSELDAKYKAIRFLPEWNESQFKAMRKAIRMHFYNKPLYANGKEYIAAYRTFQQLDELIGFAYTSSSSYAGYWVTNVDLRCNKYPDYRYIDFAMSEDLKPYAILWDKQEREIKMPI